MSENATVPVIPLNHERVTNRILRKASRKASVATRGTDIVIDCQYKSRAAHDEVIRMLLTRKVRAVSPPLHYRGTCDGKHTFRIP